MVQIFYSIFNNNDELMFANNTQYKNKQDAIDNLEELHRTIIKQPNIEILQYTKDTLKFIDKPKRKFEANEIHMMKII